MNQEAPTEFNQLKRDNILRAFALLTIPLKGKNYRESRGLQYSYVRRDTKVYARKSTGRTSNWNVLINDIHIYIRVVTTRH